MKNAFQEIIAGIESMGTLKLAAIVAGILALFILIVERPGGGGSSAANGHYLIPTMNADTTTKVEFGPLTFEKQGAKWMIDGTTPFPANPDEMQALLGSLRDLSLQTRVSNNAAKQAEFGVQDGAAGHVKVWQGTHLLSDFYAGFPSGVDSGYLRVAQTSETFMATPSLAAMVTRQADDWKDRTLIAVKEENVRRVMLTDGDVETTLEKKSASPGGAAVWSVTSPEAYTPKPDAVTDLMAQLANFSADGFVTDAEAGDYDIHNPARKISVRLNDDTMQFVYLLKKNDKGDYLVKNGEQGAIYRVAAAKVDKIFGVQFKVTEANVPAVQN